MKKKAILLFLFLPLFYSSLYSSSKYLTLSLYGQNKYMVGKMSEYALASFGNSVSLEYNFPHFQYMSLVSRLNVDNIITKKESHNNWYELSLSFGALGDYRINPIVKIGGEINYAVVLNTLSMKGEQKAFIDQKIETALVVRLSPKIFRERKMSYDIQALYSISFQKKGKAQNIGLRSGLNFYL